MTLLLLLAGTGEAAPVVPSILTQAVRMYYAADSQNVTARPTHTIQADATDAQTARPAHTHGAQSLDGVSGWMK